MKIIKGIPPIQPNNKFVSVDSEWSDINPKTMHRPTTGRFACLQIAVSEDECYLITDPLDVPKALDAIKDCVWVGFNWKFDITHLRKLTAIPPRNKLWDCMIIEQILWSGYYDSFSLASCARRYLNIVMDKSLQMSFGNALLTENQEQYAALDAVTTLRVCNAQRQIMDMSDMNIWKHVDREALWAFMAFQGFRIDVDKWANLADSNKAKKLEIMGSMPFNVNSWLQVVNHLSTRGFPRLKSSDEKTLTKNIRKYPDTEAAEIANKILLCRGYGKMASTYGMSCIENYVETEDGINVIYGDFAIIGSETGRTSCRSPNLQNIPARETKDFRNCFIPRPGNKLIVADYAAQEPRINGYLCQDESLISIFNSGKDIYTEIAKVVFNETIQGKKDPRRSQMKSVVLGVDYGMSKYGLATRENITTDAAEGLINAFLRKFPGFAIWMNRQRKEKKLVKTVMGRKLWLNPYSAQTERNALNSPIQGSAADMLKVALGYMHKEWKFDCPFGAVAAIHDELVLDVPEEQSLEISKFVTNVMKETGNEMCPGVDFKVDTSICDTWGGKE
jgi:DNA polymerase-1